MASSSLNSSATEDVDSYSVGSKVPSYTLKRNPKGVDLSKQELIQLLCSLEGEVQAREVVIAALKSERAKTLLYQAKYGRFGLGDPFLALQRDSDKQKETLDENSLKNVYDNQLVQLENLIETQKRGQQRMREQLLSVEKRYHQVIVDLEKEKRKRSQDAEESDALTCCLEKDRERLKSELDYQLQTNKKLEKELRKSSNEDRHQQVALQLVIERQALIKGLTASKQRLNELEKTLVEEQSKTKEMAEGLASQQLEHSRERAHLQGLISQLEKENRELGKRNRELEETLHQYQQRSGIPIKSQVAPSPQLSRSGLSPEGSMEVNDLTIKQRPGWSVPPGESAKKTNLSRPKSSASRGEEVSPTSSQPISVSSSYSSVPTGSESEKVFTTPSGTRISVNMKKAGGGVGRGTPPPLPPNKPQVALKSPRPLQQAERKAPPPQTFPPSALHEQANASNGSNHHHHPTQHPAVSPETGMSKWTQVVSVDVLGELDEMEESSQDEFIKAWSQEQLDSSVYATVENNYAKALCSALRAGGSANGKTSYGFSPLQRCLDLRHADCIPILLLSGAAINVLEQKYLELLLDIATLDEQVKHAVESVKAFDSHTVFCAPVLIHIEPSAFDHPSSPHTFHCGNIFIANNISWTGIENRLTTVFSHYLDQLDQFSNESDKMDLKTTSIKFFNIGKFFWAPSTSIQRTVWSVLQGSERKQVGMHLYGPNDACLDALSFQSSVPKSHLDNYVRLIQNYKLVAFYGSKHSGKTFLVRHLAEIIQLKHNSDGKTADVSYVAVHDKFNKNDLYSVLYHTGCLLLPSQTAVINHYPLVILDGLHTQGDSWPTVDSLFQDLLHLLARNNAVVTLKIKNRPDQGYYMHSNCYIVITVDNHRLHGVSQSVQQAFRWVSLSYDKEPLKDVVSRHFCRHVINEYSGGSIPSPVSACIQWVSGLSTRLNDGLVKLELSRDLIGPMTYLQCPVTDTGQTLLWVQVMWNDNISQLVKSSICNTSGKIDEDQQKVSNTALYVLLQKAVVKDCPIDGHERSIYLNGFDGCNDLDVKFSSPRRRAATPSGLTRSSTPEKLLLAHRSMTPSGPLLTSRTTTPLSVFTSAKLPEVRKFSESSVTSAPGVNQKHNNWTSAPGPPLLLGVGSPRPFPQPLSTQLHRPTALKAPRNDSVQKH